MFPNFFKRELHKIYMHVCGRPLFFNPDDGKQPKTFGLNIFNFKIFNFFSLVYKIHFIERTLWANTGIITINKLEKISQLAEGRHISWIFYKVQFN